jgi:1-acyl-sn-glycerol-3-phosphate acyltransferase
MLWLNLAAGGVILVLAYLCLRACESLSPSDWGDPWTNRLVGLITLYCRHYQGLDPRLRLPIPAQGGALVAANHVSGVDPLLLIAASPRPLRFLIAREQYRRFGLTWVFRLAGCIPVDRTGRPEQALRDALRALEAGDVVALFPHGKIHLDSDPPRKLKGGVARLAQKTGCPIFPVRLDGIRGQGHTLAALFVPSRARMGIHSSLQCDSATDSCLADLTTLLETPAAS